MRVSTRIVASVVFSFASSFAVACGEDFDSYVELSMAVCAADPDEFTIDFTNPYLPFSVGSVARLEGEEEGVDLLLVITVLDEDEVVAGVRTRVVEEREYEDGQVVEISRNFFAQAPDGTVCYFGEGVDIYANGAIVAHTGAWRAGEDDARPGIYMPAHPEAGTKFRQELAPGVAEDWSAITDTDADESVEAGDYEDTLDVVDWNPLEGQAPEDGDEKVYAKGVGLIVDGPLELVSFTPG